MPTPDHPTVMFADLRGSTALYERLGNAEATALVAGSVDLMAQAVTVFGGRVVKTLGDGLLALFDQTSAALLAADALQEALDIPAVTTRDSNGAMPRLQLALARGEVVEQAGDCFGDAVNVAARLIGHAGDGETLATAAVLEVLGADLLPRFRRVGALQLRGRSEAVEVYRLMPRLVELFGTTVAATSFQPFQPAAIRLGWDGRQQLFAADTLPLVLGRGPTADCRIDDVRVSRSHARIDALGGSFELTDLSYNGTYLRFSDSDRWIGLRRGHCTLHGSGAIRLGGSSTTGAGELPSIRFDVFGGDAPADVNR